MLKLETNWREVRGKLDTEIDRSRIFDDFLQIIYKTPLRGRNKKCVKQGYMKMAENLFVNGVCSLSESFERVVDAIERDYKQGFLKYVTYYKLKRFYKEAAEKAREFEKKRLAESVDMKHLLLKFLNAIVSLSNLPESMRASTVASLVGVDTATASEFLRWVKNSEYYPVVRFVIKSKKQETSSGQRSGLKR